MILGSIYHTAFEKPEYDYKKALFEAGFTKDKERMLEEALSYLSQFDKPIEKEKKYYVDIKYPDGKKVSIMMKFDGRSPKKITEYKTGGQLWTEEKMQDAFQPTWYSYIDDLLRGEIPEVELHSFSTKNGKAVTYQTKKTKNDFKHIPKIVKVYLDGIERDIFSVEHFDDDLKTAAMIVK